MSLAEDAVRRIQQRVGTNVRGKYRLDGLRGIGGSAAVFEATHLNGSRVALKVLHPEFARFPDVRARFLREGYVANRIAHPGVTRVIEHDYDDAEPTVFLVLELLDGETVEARSERFGGRLPLVETLDYADRVLDVLAVAHEQGVVHRDVKPGNLFLTTRGDLKVLDFGIARLLDGTIFTGSGQLLGTPAFMAPEQANGDSREIDGRTDVWSVGAVIFTLLTGTPIHPARTPAEQILYAATQQARPIESLASWLAPDVALLVNRALAFERAARWPSARAMQAALRSASSLAARPASAPTATPHEAAPVTLPHGSRAPRIPTGTIVFDLQRRRRTPDGEEP